MKQTKFLIRLKGNRPKNIFYLLAFVLMLSTQSILGQAKTITGTVVDENKVPLPGVSVLLKNTQIGAQTDFEGKYQIKISNQSSGTLVFSFIGYKSQSMTIGAKSVINLSMTPDVQTLNEVVVVGYGTQKKASVVGAISTIKGDKLSAQGNVSNLTDALSGLIPGLSVLSISGLPGGDLVSNTKVFSASEILIRGKTTWNSSSPLILVDGVERAMNDIDISEVETISVLKDASATAVFGVKGGNGVILITTKRGKEGKSSFSLQAESSYETPSDQIKALDIAGSARARNYALERNRRFSQGLWDELYMADEEVGYYKNNTYPYAYQNLNWQDVLYKSITKSYRINATASGGNEKAKYFASASYNHVGDLMNSENVGQGYLPAYSYDRFNIRSNFDFKISKTTSLAANFAGIYGVRTTPPSNTQEGLFSGTSEFSGETPILQYEDGVYGADNSRFEASNPYYRLNFLGVESEPRTTINMDYTLTQDLDVVTKGLKITGKLAYDNVFRTVGKKVNDYGLLRKTINKQFYLLGGFYDNSTKTYMLNGQPANMADWTDYQEPSTGGREGFGWVKQPNTYNSESVSLKNAERNLYYEMALRYNRTFGVHNVTALSMFSRQFAETGSNWPEKREDWVGRFTYDYDSRYLLEMNGAYNGSQKFGPNYRFDFFPSASAGWVLSNEKFLKDAAWLSQLKVRYSYGLVGNDRVNTGSTWPYLTIYDTYNFGSAEETFYGYPTAYTQLPRYNEGNPGNPDLRWEKATKQNLGFDFAAFKNKLSITAELFKENREDMLIGANERQNTVAPIYGKPAPPANIGRAKSQGAEFLINYRNSINEFNYWVSANWSVARSEVIFKESTDLTLPHQRPEGNPIGQTSASLSMGIINSWDDLYAYTGGANAAANGKLLPGDMALVDFNADGRYDRNDDKAPYGYPTYPQNNYGFSLGGDYKGFDFSIQFVGAYNATRTVAPHLFYKDNLFVPAYFLDHTWTPEYGNSNPDFPALALESLKTDAERGNFGQFYEYDGSFIRVQSAEIGYSLPKKWVSPLRISNFKLYVNGRNLFLWTKMPNDGVGMDDPGKNYPTKKQLNLGVNIKF